MRIAYWGLFGLILAGIILLNTWNTSTIPMRTRVTVPGQFPLKDTSTIWPSKASVGLYHPSKNTGTNRLPPSVGIKDAKLSCIAA